MIYVKKSSCPEDIQKVGGDECPMGDWKKCPDCQAARAKKGQGDNVEAQMSDFTKSLTAKMCIRDRKKHQQNTPQHPGKL